MGGAKKSFSRDSLVLNNSKITIDELLSILDEKKPQNAPIFDSNNILIAVNGVDSSAIDGKNTIVHSGDVVSIIPVIHGGSDPVTIMNTNFIVFTIRGNKQLDHSFLDQLRSDHPEAIIQAVLSDFILGLSHVKKILTISLESNKRGILLSDRIEIDILLRLSATTQISKAITDLGIKPKKDFAIIALGKKHILKQLQKDLSSLPTFKSFPKSNESKIQKYFKISKKQLNSINSSTPLEDILQEKATILF